MVAAIITSAKPPEYRSADTRSKWPGWSGRRTTSSSSRTVRTITASVMAPSIQNMERQPHASMRKPLMVGPMAGANPMIMPTMAVAWPYWLFG